MRGLLCFLNNNEHLNHEISISPKLLDKFMMNNDYEVMVSPEKYLYLKPEYMRHLSEVNFDLNDGIENFDQASVNDGLLPILHYIMWKSDQLDVNDLNKLIDNADIVCRRSAITKIASSLYEKEENQYSNGWKCLIEKFENVYFVRELDTDERLANDNMSYNIKFNYWRYKFDQYLFAEKGKEPTPSKPISGCKEMHVAFSTIFPSNSTENEFKLFYSTETDGYDDVDKIVEVKTQPYELFNRPSFELKAMKWWLRSSIIGVDNILVGLRTNKGKVFKLQKVNLQQLERRCNEWDGNICFNTFQHVMNVARDKYNKLVQPNELLLIEKKPNHNIIEYSIVSKDDYPEQVLTNEFKDRFKK